MVYGAVLSLAALGSARVVVVVGVGKVVMSFLVVSPDVLASAADGLARIGSGVSAANAVAEPSTTGLVAAAGDEVSTAIASLFSRHGEAFQAVSSQVSVFHAEFVQALAGAGGLYAGAEAGNVSPLLSAAQGLAVFSPVKDLTGRPLFGNGVNGAAGTGQAGGGGGWVIGTAAMVGPG